MFKKLFVLVQMQLSEKLKFKNTASTGFKVATIAKTFGGVAVAYGIFTGLFYLIFNVLFMTPSFDMFTFFIFFLQIVSIITCVVAAGDILYTSKDNMLLLTYPVKHGVIYASKIIVLYILELIKSLILNFPLMMAYATIIPGIISVNYVLSAIGYSLLLPLMPVLLGAIISIPFVFFTKVFKQSNIIKIVFSAALFGLLLFATIGIANFIEANSPIEIVKLFRKYSAALEGFFKSANRFSLYCLFIGRAMYTKDASVMITNHLYMLLVFLGTAVLSVLVSLPTFYKLSSSATENSNQKKHKGLNKTHKSTFITFIRKELTLSIRKIGNFASDYAFLFAMPFILALLTVVFANINRSNLGNQMTYAFVGLVTLVMLCASNTASATAISSEGNEFVILKTAPGKTSNIIWSKIIINFIIAFIMTTVSYAIIFIILRKDFQAGLLEANKLLIVYGYVNIIEAGLLLWSIQLDIVNPKLREFANSQNASDNKNTLTSIFVGLIFSVLFSLILIVLFILKGIEIWLVAVLALLIALTFTGIRFYLLIQYRNVYFEDIQL